MAYVIIFLCSVVLANLTVGWFGPKVTPIVSFCLIGLDLSMRDKIHEAWHGKNLIAKMSLLILASGVITYIINRNAGSIALGSVVAFMAALSSDALVYEFLFSKKRLYKMNASNVVSAAVDTFLFVWIAFGNFLWLIMLMQYAAKVLGGLFWSYVLTKFGKEVEAT